MFEYCTVTKPYVHTIDCLPIAVLTLQSFDQDSFWQGDDVICWSQQNHGFQYFPTLTISLAVSENETIRLIVSPQQYLRFVGASELLLTDLRKDCYRVSISPSESGKQYNHRSLCVMK